MTIYLKYPDQEYHTGNESFDEMANNMVMYAMERNKYWALWTLRSLEEEINDSGGMITLDFNNDFTLKDFSVDLATRIYAILKAAKR